MNSLTISTRSLWKNLLIKSQWKSLKLQKMMGLEQGIVCLQQLSMGKLSYLVARM